MPGQESLDVVKLKSECQYCRSEIQLKAIVCPSCGHYKNYYLNLFKHIASLTALVMVCVAIAQLIIAFGEKIDTQNMLKEVEAVKVKADIVLTNVEKQENQLSQRLNTVSSNIDILTQNLESIKQESVKKQQALSVIIEKTKTDADQKILKVIGSVNQQASDSKKRLDKTESDFKKKQDILNRELNLLKNELTAQLEKLKFRDHILQLTDAAIYNDDRESFDKLWAIAKENEPGSTKRSVAISNILQIKSFYISVKRYEGVSFEKWGETVKIDDLSTSEIIMELKTNSLVYVRSKAAECLKNRKEKGVPEALIEVAKTDKKLTVVRNCIRSFGIITGYKSPDIFKVKYIQKYWNDNKSEVELKLKEPDQIIKDSN